MFYQILQVAGSLGLFLFGMRTMSDGIQKAAGDRLQKIIGFMTGNRFAGVLTGFGITSIIQSSSATTVMVVSFVNAGLLSLAQAIGIGVPLIFWKRLRKADWGEALVGFGLLFLGLSFLKAAVPDIDANPESLRFVKDLTGYGLLSRLLFVAIGTGLTVILQSSSASMAITLTMAFFGWIDFPSAAAAHMTFNILGIVWIMILFFPVIDLVDRLVPGAMHSEGGITAHLAMFHTTFNVLNTLLFLGFVNWIERIVTFVVRRAALISPKEYRLEYLSTSLQDTPELNLVRAKAELVKMAGVVKEMYGSFIYLFENPKKKLKEVVEELQEKEELTDQMQEELSRYLG